MGQSEATVLVRFCNACESPLGTLRVVLALKKCPECGARLLPVEEYTHAKRVKEA